MGELVGKPFEGLLTVVYFDQHSNLKHCKMPEFNEICWNFFEFRKNDLFPKFKEIPAYFKEILVFCGVFD